MENKINIAEILKDCPAGMELDCTMFENVTFEDIKQGEYPITVKIKKPSVYLRLTKNGCWNSYNSAKCVIFPKGKTTWEGFVPPCQFKVGDWITNGDYTWKVISVDNLDYTLQNQLGESVYDTIDYVNKAFHLWTINDAKDGDVLFHSDSASNGIFIFNKILQRGTIQKVICYCDYDSEDGFCLGENHTCCWTDSKFLHPATKEQRDILFQKIKEAGYEWVSETKTLEKLLKFKDGDIVATMDGSWIGITKGGKKHDFIPTYCVAKSDGKFEAYFDRKEEWVFGRLATEEEKQKLFDAIKANGYKWNEETKTLEKLPKFKVGDRIKKKGIDDVYAMEITEVTQTIYTFKNGSQWGIESVDKDYELVPNKFDINTLKPFDNCKYSLDGGKTWKFAQYWYVQDKYDVNEIEIDLWLN